jgi:K+-sensing histidine kinase KdpD
VFARAKRLLRKAHVPSHAVETQIADTVTRQDLVRDMLELARTLNCGTGVVGRESLYGLKALVTSHVSDTLVRQAHGLTVWVVE